MQRGDKLAFAGNLLIEASTELQNTACVSELEFDKPVATEFCTIRLSAGRRSGHGYAAARIIRDNFKMVLYVSCSPNMIEIARLECNEINVASEVVFADIHCLNSVKYDGLYFDAVIVDPGSVFTPDQIDMVYKRTIPMLANRKNKYWILIG